MAKKEREALAFVRKTKGAKDILFAVTGMPERTTYSVVIKTNAIR